MNEKIIIRNLTIKNILELGKPLILLIFIFYCLFNFGFGDSKVLRNLLIFLYLAGAMLTIISINYFTGITIIDENGLKKKSLFFSHSVKWENVKSVNVKLTIANRFTKILDKKEYFDEFYIGKKEILISDLNDQLNQSTIIKWKKIIRLPFDENLINLLKHYKKF